MTYIEQTILLHVLNGENKTAVELLSTMTGRELRGFLRAVLEAQDLIEARLGIARPAPAGDKEKE